MIPKTRTIPLNPNACVRSPAIQIIKDHLEGLFHPLDKSTTYYDIYPIEGILRCYAKGEILLGEIKYACCYAVNEDYERAVAAWQYLMHCRFYFRQTEDFETSADYHLIFEVMKVLNNTFKTLSSGSIEDMDSIIATFAEFNINIYGMDA